MGEVRCMISEAATQVKVESHVLRYWEEELDLVIGRTEMGHRYYTKDDIQLFRCIKKLKDEGMLLKDLKPLIPELKATRLKVQASDSLKSQDVQKQDRPKIQEATKNIKTTENSATAANLQSTSGRSHNEPESADLLLAKEMKKTLSAQSSTGKKTTLQSSPDNTVAANPLAVLTAKDKPAVAQAEVIPVTQLEQVRSLIGDVLTEVVTTNNDALKKEISQTVTKDVIREMDFLFQAKERQEEEHFRKLDCLIRQQQANRKEAARETPIGKLKKLLN